MEISLPNRKTEIIGGNAFSYICSDRNNVSIGRDALYDMITDMNRKYETAGLFFGNLKNDIAVLEKYVPMKGLIRSKNSVQYQIDVMRSQLEYYAKKGYNSVMFVHSHPLFYKNNTLDKISGNGLNYFDSRIALEYHKPLSAELGFKQVYEGVLSIQPIKKEGSNKNRLFSLQAFDLEKGANSAEGFSLNGYIKRKMHAADLLRKDLQTIKYAIDEVSLGGIIMAELPVNNQAYSSYIKKLNETVYAMDIPNRIKRHIGVIVDDSNSSNMQGDIIVCLTIPPIAYNLHLKHYIELIDHIMSKISNPYSK